MLVWSYLPGIDLDGSEPHRSDGGYQIGLVAARELAALGDDEPLPVDVGLVAVQRELDVLAGAVDLGHEDELLVLALPFDEVLDHNGFS